MNVSAFWNRVVPADLMLYSVSGVGRRVALSFEGRPDARLQSILDILGEFNATATFFFTGRDCVNSRPLLREVVSRGHDVAARGWTGRPWSEMSPQELSAELAASREAVPAQLQRFLRPPEGHVDLRSALLSWRHGFQLVLWSRDSAADGDDHDAVTLVDRITRGSVTPGDIVRLCTTEDDTVVEALPYALASLRSADIQPVSVLELANLAA